MITEIQPQQLSFLLQVSKKDARKMLAHIKSLSDLDMDLCTDHELRCSVEEFEKKKGIKISLAIEDIYNNAIKRPAFKKYLLEYPLKKIKPEEEKDLKYKISLPTALKSLLSEYNIQEIEKYWNAKYNDLIPKNQTVYLKP